MHATTDHNPITPAPSARSRQKLDVTPIGPLMTRLESMPVFVAITNEVRLKRLAASSWDQRTDHRWTHLSRGDATLLICAGTRRQARVVGFTGSQRCRGGAWARLAEWIGCARAPSLQGRPRERDDRSGQGAGCGASAENGQRAQTIHHAGASAYAPSSRRMW